MEALLGKGDVDLTTDEITVLTVAADHHAATLVDSNVLLDIVTADPTWSPWSRRQLAEALDRGPVVINQVVYGFPHARGHRAILTQRRVSVRWKLR